VDPIEGLAFEREILSVTGKEVAWLRKTRKGFDKVSLRSDVFECLHVRVDTDIHAYLTAGKKMTQPTLVAANIQNGTSHAKVLGIDFFD